MFPVDCVERNGSERAKDRERSGVESLARRSRRGCQDRPFPTVPRRI